MAKYTLDRFEKDKAVLLQKGNETLEKILNRVQLPENIKEGDIVEVFLHDDGTLKEVVILQQETETARKQAQSLLEKLKNKNRE